MNPTATPKDFFLHGLLIVTLYMSVVSFILLLFQYVTLLLPDQLDFSPRGAFDGIRWGTSVLIVAVPVFLWLSRMLEKEWRATPAKREVKIRKWLVYFTLFIAALTIIVDLIAAIYNFYGGELTTRFLLKVLIVLATAAAVFGYYLWDLKRTSAPTTIPQKSAWATGIVVLISIVAGVWLAGSPNYQRQLRFDEQRVADLQTIQSQTVYFWSQKQQLPRDLDALRDSISGFSAPRDPATGEPYEYTLKSALEFELCATFAQPGGNSNGGVRPAVLREPTAPVPVDPAQDNWSHEAGHTCFTRTIDPDLYKKP